MSNFTILRKLILMFTLILIFPFPDSMHHTAGVDTFITYGNIIYVRRRPPEVEHYLVIMKHCCKYQLSPR